MTAANWTPDNGSMRDVALEVLLHGPLSRTEVARRLDLSQASLTRLTRPLLDGGLLVEAEPRAEPTGGRPGTPLDVVPGSHHFAGVNLTGVAAHGVLTDLRGTVLGSTTRPLPSHDPDDVADVTADLVEDLVRGTDGEVGSVTGVGVGLGGHSPDRSRVRVAPFLDWHDVPLGELLTARTGRPTVVENDVVALTAAEHWFGDGKDTPTFAVVTVGAGVGFGLVVHGRQVTHPDQGIGLVGHVPLAPVGPPCPEGHRGCASAMLTIPALTSQARVALLREVGYDELLDLAAAGDPAAGRLVDDAAAALGRLVAWVANLTTPERVVLTGEGVRLATVGEAALQAALTEDRPPHSTPVDLVVRPGDFSLWARGAAVAAVQAFVLRGV